MHFFPISLLFILYIKVMFMIKLKSILNISINHQKLFYSFKSQIDHQLTFFLLSKVPHLTPSCLAQLEALWAEIQPCPKAFKLSKRGWPEGRKRVWNLSMKWASVWNGFYLNLAKIWKCFSWISEEHRLLWFSLSQRLQNDSDSAQLALYTKA